MLCSLSLSLLAFSHCGADFDNPPNVVGAYTKTSEKCGNAFLKMPDSLDIEQINADIEINPETGADLEGSIDNDGNIEAEESSSSTSCKGKYNVNNEELTLDCKIEGTSCSGAYQKD